MPELPPPLPTATAEAPPLIVRGSRAGTVLASAAILLTVVLALWFTPRWTKELKGAAAGPNVLLEMLGRYVAGCQVLFKSTGAWNAETEAQLLESCREGVRTDADKLRLVMLRGWLDDRSPSPSETFPGLEHDVEVLRHLAGKQEIAEDTWKPFEKKYGWFARAAKALSHDKGHALRQQVKLDAMRTMLVFGIGIMGGFAAFIAGLVMLILLLVRWRASKRTGTAPPLRLTLEQEVPEVGGTLIEAFAIYMISLVVLPTLIHLAFPALNSYLTYALIAPIVLFAVWWPRLRGVPAQRWKQVMGLHSGAGVWREIGAGLTAWIACLPVVALGLWLTTLLIRLSGVEMPVHPIVNEFAAGGASRYLPLLLAVLWAPVTEELAFRGMLFPGLSTRLRWIPGAVLSCFIFAVIHPQGWFGVPMLMIIAGMLAFVRQWRGSVLGGMAAHALNNGLVTLFVLLAF
jgi:membrane protease YdiL (CAAX protease family)